MIVALTATTGVVSIWAANLFGTSGPDTLVGTDNDDNIYGLGGNDRIRDGFGSDRTFAGSGDDTIRVDGTQDRFGNSGAASGQDVVYGEGGKDNIDARNIEGSFLIYAGDDHDTIAAGSTGESGNGRIYGGGGNDKINTAAEGIFDIWGGSGDDEMNGASECTIDHAYGESGNDRIISPNDFSSGGSGNDVIQFQDCGGVAYGDSGDDELRGGGDDRVELHGGSGDDNLEASFGGDELFGEGDDDTLVGAQGATFFSCGPGIDTIIDFNAAEGDTKTADCENF